MSVIKTLLDTMYPGLKNPHQKKEGNTMEIKCKVNAVYIHNQLYKALDTFDIDSEELQIEHMAQIISNLSNELSSKLYRDTGYKMGQATNELRLYFNNDHL